MEKKKKKNPIHSRKKIQNSNKTSHIIYLEVYLTKNR